MRRSRRLAPGIGAMLVVFALAGAPAARADDGSAVYEQHCASCHKDAGEGAGSFPALAGNPRLADAAYLKQTIQAGKGMMPAFKDLPPADLDALVTYLQTAFGGGGQTASTDAGAPAPGSSEGGGGATGGAGGSGNGSTTTTPTPLAAPPPAGDADRGRLYYIGQLRFQSGATPCVACHTARGSGGLPGGGIGTDLTDLATRMGGETGVAGVLADPAFKVMAAAYQNKPLSPQERADLGAFFERLSGSSPASPSFFVRHFWTVGALGLLALFAALALARPRGHASPAQTLRDSHREERGA